MTTTKKRRPLGQNEYTNRLVDHFLIGTPKPQAPDGPPIKEYPDVCVLTEEQLFDLTALLFSLQDFDNECQGPPESVLDTYFACRDEVEEALAYFLAPFCVDDESPAFVPEYNRDIRQFNDDLNNYLLALRLALGIYVPKLFQRYQCLVLGFTIKLARMRVLTGFDKLCSQGVHWTYHRD